MSIQNFVDRQTVSDLSLSNASSSNVKNSSEEFTKRPFVKAVQLIKEYNIMTENAKKDTSSKNEQEKWRTRKKAETALFLASKFKADGVITKNSMASTKKWMNRAVISQDEPLLEILRGSLSESEAFIPEEIKAIIFDYSATLCYESYQIELKKILIEYQLSALDKISPRHTAQGILNDIDVYLHGSSLNSGKHLISILEEFEQQERDFLKSYTIQSICKSAYELQKFLGMILDWLYYNIPSDYCQVKYDAIEVEFNKEFESFSIDVNSVIDGNAAIIDFFKKKDMYPVLTKNTITVKEAIANERGREYVNMIISSDNIKNLEIFLTPFLKAEGVPE